MKKLNISSILYIMLLIIFLTFIVSLYDDVDRKKLYNSNYEYNLSENLNISADVYIDKKIIMDISNLAKNNNILLEKNVIKENKIVYHYLNFTNYKELYKVLKISNYSEKPISTVLNLSNEKYCLKKDFLNNDLHTFLLFDSFYENETNYNGEYHIFYNTKEDYNNFIADILELLQIDKNQLSSNGNKLSESNINLQKKFYFITFTILIISIIVSSLFHGLKNSSSIGIYRLNGFSNVKIIKYSVLKDLKTDIVLTIIVFVLFNILVKNNNISYVIISFIVCLIILLFKTLLSSLCIYKIAKKININNLIKKIKITGELLKFNFIFKMFAFTVIILLMIFLGLECKTYISRKNEIKNFMKYSDYAVFSQFYGGNDFESFTGGSNDLDEAELNLYKYLEKFDVIYVDFRDYNITSKEEENYYNTLTNKGNKKFRYGIIDTNYLKDLKLIDSKTNKYIEIDNQENNNIFLIPKSLSNDVENFKDFYYEYYDKNENDKFLVYDDVDIPSMSLDIASNSHYLISSPILKVITPNNVQIRDVCVYGVGYDTPLKIKVNSNNKKDFFKQLEPELIKLGLDDNLNINTFFTYDELFSNELNSIIKQLTIFVILLLFLFGLYLYVSLQNIVLQVKDRYKEISIKKLNGWSNIKIFKKYIFNMIIINFLISLIIMIAFNQKIDFIELFVLLVTVNASELLINYIIIKIKLRNFIISAIKGGEI